MFMKNLFENLRVRELRQVHVTGPHTRKSDMPIMSFQATSYFYPMFKKFTQQKTKKKTSTRQKQAFLTVYTKSLPSDNVKKCKSWTGFQKAQVGFQYTFFFSVTMCENHKYKTLFSSYKFWLLQYPLELLSFKNLVIYMIIFHKICQTNKS